MSVEIRSSRFVSLLHSMARQVEAEAFLCSQLGLFAEAWHLPAGYPRTRRDARSWPHTNDTGRGVVEWRSLLWYFDEGCWNWRPFFWRRCRGWGWAGDEEERTSAMNVAMTTVQVIASMCEFIRRRQWTSW